MKKTNWWQTATVYHIYPQSFKDTNGDGWGDLQGIIQKLDYLQDLGIDAVWLSPIYESPLVDGGYDISDYYSIHPDYGTMDDFRELLSEAHKRNIRVIMDLVLNHTSDRHKWFVESRTEITHPKRNWYIWQKPRNGKKPNNWRTNFGKKAWNLSDETGEFYYHSFFPEQPDLNWRNPEVKEAMFAVVKFWLEIGVDGFRLDVVNFLIKNDELRDNSFFLAPKKIYNRNQPEVYQILREFRALLDSYPDKMSVGEIYTHPPGTPELAASFLGKGSDMLHLAFDFSLVFAFWRAKSYYKIIQNQYRYIPADGWACFFLSNHDIGRSVKRFNFFPNKYKKAKLRAVLLLTLRGTPFIYYGDEIGMENTFVPYRKIRDLYGKMLYPFFTGRDAARTPMQWNNDFNAGFSGVEPWLPINKNYSKINVAVEEQDENSIYSIYKKLLSLRKNHEILQIGELEFLFKGEENVLAYYRYDANERLLILLNFGFRRKRLKIEGIENAGILFSTHQKLNTRMWEYISLEAHEGLILML